MNSLTLCTLFLTLCLLFILQSPLPTNARALGHHGLLGDNPDLINQICNDQTILARHDTINCTSIMRADPNIVRATNFLELSVTILNMAISQVTEGRDLLMDLTFGKDDSEAIHNCAFDYYESVLDDFKEALHYLNNNDNMLANSYAAYAGEDATACENDLASDHIVNPTISALNHQTALLSVIAVVATNKLFSS